MNDDPVWSLTIINATRGWSMSCTQGEEPDPDAAAFLMDSSSIEWGFEGDDFPGFLEPDTATFVIGAATLRDLPDMDHGDEIAIALQIPGGTSYYSGILVLSDVQIAANPHAPTPIVARVYATDDLAAAENRRYLRRNIPDSWLGFEDEASGNSGWLYGPYDRLDNLAHACRVNIAVPEPIAYSGADAQNPEMPPLGFPGMQGLDPFDTSVRELLQSTVSNAWWEGHLWVIRATRGWTPSPAQYRLVTGDPSSAVIYTLMPLRRADATTVAAMTLYRGPDGQLALDVPDTVGADAVRPTLPRESVHAPTAYRLDGRSRTTHITAASQSDFLTGWDFELNLPVVGGYDTRRERPIDGDVMISPDGGIFGLEPHLHHSRDLLEAWRPWLTGHARYALPELEIDPQLLDPDTLANIAGELRLNTNPATALEGITLPELTITNLDPSIRPPGQTIVRSIIRTRFEITRGDLKIIVTPHGHIGPPSAETTGGLVALADLETLGDPTLADAADLTFADTRQAGV